MQTRAVTAARLNTYASFSNRGRVASATGKGDLSRASEMLRRIPPGIPLDDDLDTWLQDVGRRTVAREHRRRGALQSPIDHVPVLILHVHIDPRVWVLPLHGSDHATPRHFLRGIERHLCAVMCPEDGRATEQGDAKDQGEDRETRHRVLLRTKVAAGGMLTASSGGFNWSKGQGRIGTDRLGVDEDLKEFEARGM